MQLQPLVSSWTQKRADALISYERPAEWPFLQEEIEAGRSHSSGRRDRDRRPLSVFTKLFFKLALLYLSVILARLLIRQGLYISQISSNKKLSNIESKKLIV